MTDPHQEAERTAALAATMHDPFCKRRMTAISESWEHMGRYDAVKVPQHERGD